jgi:hypothetical protein
LDALGRLSVTDLRRRTLTRLPALERRRIAHPKAQDYADFQSRLQQGFGSDEMGFGVSVQGSNPEPLMSALGQKQTFNEV